MAHTLTGSNDSSGTITVTVNNNVVTSPYTLQNGDTITISWTTGFGYYPFVNGTQVSNGTSLDLSDTDVEFRIMTMGGGIK